MSGVIVVDGIGAFCSVGLGIRQVYAAVQAGIGRIAESPIYDRQVAPMRMSLVPESALEPLVPEVASAGLAVSGCRMVRLAAAPLRECLIDLAPDHEPPPLFLGLPEPSTPRTQENPRALPGALALQAGVSIDEKASQVFPRGGASVLLALESAVRYLIDGRATSVVVGGVDSFVNLRRLGELDFEQRILGPSVSDGFIPGEGAAFVRLSMARAARSTQVVVLGAATARDPGHRYSEQPARGEGLSQAIEKLFAGLKETAAPIKTTYAGFNGESWGAKEWGVARLRHNDRFSPAAQIEHPADCYGDVGAATGALLLALSARALGRQERQGPALVFASSDREDRACALLDVLV